MITLLAPFYNQNTVTVAGELIGKRLVRITSSGVVSGIITETEAYCFDTDPASHAYRGKTERNSAMFGPVGHAYVYTIYGIHSCFNIVARATNTAAGAVLVRSVIPFEGLEVIQDNRGSVASNQLTNGPAKLAQAFAITKQDNGYNCISGDFLYITEYESVDQDQIICTPRIGISKATDKLWRFVCKG